jgi:GlpG protein
MRQLATLASADAARTLADYLLTLQIETRLEQQPDGVALWVCDEDQLPRARLEWEAFAHNPSDARFQSAASTADALRRQKLQEEKDYEKRQKRFYSRMGAANRAGPWTLALIIASAIVLLLKDATSFGPSLVQTLSIAPTDYVLVATDRELRWEPRSPGLEPILHGQIWRLVTPVFLHFGIWHLVFNMWWLYDLGGAIERKRGPLRYVALVVVLAVLSNLTQYFLGHPIQDGGEIKWLTRSNFGGMSGVVYGLFGYVWMKARFQPELGLSMHPNTIIFMMLWFVLCMTPWIGFFIGGGGVANAAHAGGLIAGMLIGYVPTTWRSFKSD